MNLLILAGLAAFIYMMVQFGRQESVQEYYEETINDVDARFEWAKTRSFYPFGMEAQLDNSWEWLEKAKELWSQRKWHDAYRAAKQSQAHMNQAQEIFSNAIKARQEDEKRAAARKEAEAGDAETA